MAVGGVDEVVAALRALPGVADAEISSEDSDNGAGTLRLSLTPGADEVRVAASVNRVLRDRFSLAVDADRVQVVDEVNSRGREAPRFEPRSVGPQPVIVATPAGSRVLIERMQLVSAGLGISTEVSLGWAGETYRGSADATATPASVHRAVAEATLRAVEAAVDGKARFAVEHVETAQLGSERAIVVEVAMVTGKGNERLTGVSAVRDDTRQAVIRATLDALNRRIETLLVG